MATTTSLMTVDEFRKLPETGPFFYELRHGEPVQVTRPKAKHYVIQYRLQDLLREKAQSAGFVGVELAFRPRPEHELRVADVAFVSKDRWQKLDPDDNLHGAPELVVEVLSASNTVAEINDKEKLCLENGCQEFWIVDPILRQVKVSKPDGITTTFQTGQEVPVRVLGGGAFSVDAVFG